MKLFSQCFSECVLVEFGYEGNTYSRGLVAQESLRKALRPDMAELLASTYKDRAKDFNDLFLIIYNPRLMFEFNEFKGIFAREIIPAQVVMGRDLIIFDPTPLETFGLH